jgi:hypothetical protein
MDYLNKHNLTQYLVEIKNCKSVHKVQLATLQVVDNKRNIKDYTFEYIEKK